jgi:hypothetical protein
MTIGSEGGMIGPIVAEAAVIAFLLHRPDLERTDAAGIGDGGAGHSGKDDAGEDVGMAQAAADPADACGCKGEDAVGDAGRVHYVAHQDEQRRGEQRKRVRRLGDLLRHDVDGHAVQRHECEGGEPHGGEHRHAEHQRREPDHQNLQHDLGHSGSSCSEATIGSPRNASTICNAAWNSTAKPAIGMGM